MRFFGVIVTALLFSANALTEGQAADGLVQAELPDTVAPDDALESDEPIGNPTPLRMMHWLDPDQDRAAHVTQLPSQDIRKGISALTELGRVAFRAPAMMGGYAAELGLSCNACHPAGKRETLFKLPPLSPRMGQVDISHALFGPDGDDRQDNPRPIRDLTQATGPYGTINPTDDLRTYIEAKLTDNFSGQSPDPLVLDALTAYVHALKDGTNETSPYAHESPDKQMVRHYLDAIARAFFVGDQTISERQVGASLMVIDAIRAEVGRLHERLDPEDPARPLLAKHAASLSVIANQITTADWLGAARQLQRIRLALSEDTTPILSRADLTYFNYDWLAGAIDPSLREPLEEDTALDADADSADQDDQ